MTEYRFLAFFKNILLARLQKDIGMEYVHDQITGFWCFNILLTGMPKDIGMECVHDQRIGF